MAAGGPGVSVLAPNGRRQIVKVTAGTPLLQILEDVCKKQNFNPKEYDLKFQRTVLDLSLQWRFANLPNNAKLEMVSCTQQRAGAESTKTRVAFQLEDGLRLQHEFVCSNSLWDVVSHFPETRPYLDQAASEHFPVCIYMRDEVTGEPALRQTSLQSLGITGGSIIIRFLMRKSTPSVPEVVSEEQKDSASEEPTVSKVKESLSASEEPTVSKVKESPPASEKPTVSKVKESPPASEETTVSKVKESPPATEQEEDKPAVHKEDQSPSDKLENPKSAPEAAVCDRITKASSFDRKKQQNMESSGTIDEQTPSCSGSSQSHPHTLPAPFIPFQGGGQRLGDASTSTLPHVPCVTAKEPFRSPGPSKPKKSKTEAEEGDTGCQSVTKEPPLVYHLDLEEKVNIKFHEPTDEFFEVTVDDIRRRFSELRSERQKFEESPLLTKAMRESQEKEKLERYPKVVLRVLFPDRYVLQGFFHVTETVGQVKEFVLHHLEDSQLPFYLFVTPPRTELKDDSQALFQAGLYPAAVVHFGSQIKRDHYLCQEVLQSPVPPSEADLIVSREMPCVLASPAAPVLENIPCAQAEEATRPPNDSTNTEESPVPHHQVQVPRDHGIMPKWLKLPGKK